jgi:hypothetical protein
VARCIYSCSLRILFSLFCHQGIFFPTLSFTRHQCISSPSRVRSIGWSRWNVLKFGRLRHSLELNAILILRNPDLYLYIIIIFILLNLYILWKCPVNHWIKYHYWTEKGEKHCWSHSEKSISWNISSVIKKGTSKLNIYGGRIPYYRRWND